MKTQRKTEAQRATQGNWLIARLLASDWSDPAASDAAHTEIPPSALFRPKLQFVFLCILCI